MHAPLQLEPHIRAVLIAGPTASGKSAIAMDLARRAGQATIINADSMQVYGDLHILSARPSLDDEAEIEHRLYGVVPAADTYSVGRWLSDVTAVLAELPEKDNLAIIVGGTGLYFKVLLEGLASIPAIDPEIRALWRGRLLDEGAESLRAELKVRDPNANDQAMVEDPQRLIRTLEVLDGTGRPLRDWLSEGQQSPLAELSKVQRIALMPDRQHLYDRINARTRRMLDTGAIEEAEALLSQNLSPGLPAMKAIGIREIGGFLRGEWQRDALDEMIAMQTRRYAKRQLTWIRNQMTDWPIMHLPHVGA